MNCAKISILEQSNKVSLSRLLQRRHGGALESEIGFEILSDFTDQPLERKLPDEKFGALLVLSDLTECNCTWPEPVWLLHSAGRRSRFPSGFGSQLLPWCLAAGRLPSKGNERVIFRLGYRRMRIGDVAYVEQ
ncbi:hypothetical protein Lal_00007958 [Lupinus albus]|nr:hypothetical protein Lal_00007958 [Lupinus albus]